MKKRKIYEISVIDKTYSKIISDETKFYTSDTALELVFKLKETEYTFESAEIVLLNIDDRSLVTRPVTKSLDSFTYELDDDITAHYGDWRGQLRFEAGETYVSSPVKFRIENDLGNDRPPQLSDVQSWVSLKRYADSLTEELKQAVLEVEGMDDTFNANELERQTTFVDAEQSRQTTFETNESERNQTFESNETARQAQELEREKAESQRQTAFDGNEAIRTETFNTNEATRKANEEARELAENDRGNSEEQRKIDHANRSAELDVKADKVALNNLFANGDFRNGTNNWTPSGGTLEVQEGGLVFTITNPAWNTQIRLSSRGNVLIGKYYWRVVANTPTGIVDLRLGDVPNAQNGESGAFDVYSNVVKADSNISSYNPIYLNTAGQPVNTQIIVKSVLAINLTQTFGAGNEPTQEEMDELIKVTGYIDGEYALNNKELMIWTLALIRRNKNAIVALGGA